MRSENITRSYRLLTRVHSPAMKLAALVPAPPAVLNTTPIPSTSALPSNIPIRPSLSPSPSPSPSNPPPSQQPQYFKILPRSLTPSSTPKDSEKGKEKSKKDLTLEERELSYRAARSRIFKNSSDGGGFEEGSSVGGNNSEVGSNYSRSSSQRPFIPPIINESYYSQPLTHLRPSAPAFSPNNGNPTSWSTYSSTTTYQNGEFTSQYGVTYSTTHSQLSPPNPFGYNYQSPSPALSTTSSSSSNRNRPSASPTASLNGSNGGGGGGGGYLMRFPEGGTIWPKGEGSVGSGGSERTASSVNVRGGDLLGSSTRSGRGESSLSSKTTSTSSTSSLSEIRNSGFNEHKRMSGSNASGSGSSITGSDSGKVKGKARERGMETSHNRSQGDAIGAEGRLHPSLPAKPVWSTLPTLPALQQPVPSPSPPPSQPYQSVVTPAWHSLPIQPLEQYSTFPTNDYYPPLSYQSTPVFESLTGNHSNPGGGGGERRRPIPRSTELFCPNSGGN